MLPFIAPALILMLMYVLYPLLKNIYISLTDFSILPNAANEFVGLENYRNVFATEKSLFALRNSFLMVAVTVPIQLFLGFILAYLINSLTLMKSFFKTAYYIPVVTSWLVVAYIFKYIFAGGEGGLINYFLSTLGITDTPISWLQSTFSALVVIWIVSIWKGVGWTMIIYLAGLQGVDNSLIESSQLDGANKPQMLFKIILPSLKPVTFYLVVNMVIGAFNSFIQTYIITDGGPVNTTHVMMSLMYTEAFDNFEFGVAAAIGVVQGLAVLVMIILLKTVLKKALTD